MKLVAPVKLSASTEDKERMLATMRRVNEAASWLAERAFETKCVSKFALQKAHYRDLRNRFGLSAQHAVRVIAKVCEVYKRDTTKRCTFRPLGAIPYDPRIYSFKDGLARVSLLTLDGRIVLPCAVGAYHRARLEGLRGQADLVYREGEFYLFVSIEAPAQAPVKPDIWLGVDLGIRNLAVDSDRAFHSGEPTLAVRSRIAKLRRGLQSAGTKSAKRHLRKLRRREQNFHSHTNHVISKEIVRKAKDTGRGIALEDLKGIRDRVTVRKAQRANLHSWSFSQLRVFIAYKATLSGVALVAVDPRNTSRTCPECGCIDKANRKTQSEFACTGCGFTEHADVIGARNIAARAQVIAPIGSDARLSIEKHSSPQLCQAQSPHLAVAAGGG